MRSKAFKLLWRTIIPEHVLKWLESALKCEIEAFNRYWIDMEEKDEWIEPTIDGDEVEFDGGEF